jgi:hypothetical protein
MHALEERGDAWVGALEVYEEPSLLFQNLVIQETVFH